MNSAAAAPSRVRPRRRGVFLAVRRPRAARHSSARGACSCAGQILSPSRRVGRPSPRGVFSRGANPFARAPCREAFAEGRVLAWGQILSPSRRVGRLSPRGVFLRGANPFARAPCREAFAVGRVPARGKSCPPPRDIGKLWRAIGSSPRGARRPAGGTGSACGLGGRSGPRVGLPKALLQQPQRLCLVATR